MTDTPEDGFHVNAYEPGQPEHVSIGMALDEALSTHAEALEQHAEALEHQDTRLRLAERAGVIAADRVAQLAAALARQSADLADFQSTLAYLQRRLP